MIQSKIVKQGQGAAPQFYKELTLKGQNGDFDAKELVNLILGRTEVAKAEILKIVGSEIPLENKYEQISGCEKSAEDYFHSVMAQND